MVQMHLVFKRDVFRDVLDTVNMFEQVYPEFLGFALFVAFPFPVFGKFLGGDFLLYLVHLQFLSG